MPQNALEEITLSNRKGKTTTVNEIGDCHGELGRRRPLHSLVRFENLLLPTACRATSITHPLAAFLEHDCQALLTISDHILELGFSRLQGSPGLILTLEHGIVQLSGLLVVSGSADPHILPNNLGKMIQALGGIPVPENHVAPQTLPCRISL